MRDSMSALPMLASPLFRRNWIGALFHLESGMMHLGGISLLTEGQISLWNLFFLQVGCLADPVEGRHRSLRHWWKRGEERWLTTRSDRRPIIRMQRPSRELWGYYQNCPSMEASCHQFHLLPVKGHSSHPPPHRQSLPQQDPLWMRPNHPPHYSPRCMRYLGMKLLMWNWLHPS